ncbi:MAG: hypothetical protein U1D67_03390, partial [Dehalococcoidia bacterium]|nr:hypothetical protein [Dehalococcoidia bacterium]
IEGCRAHLHHDRGTVAYLGGILPEIASQLSGERIKSFLGRQFAADLKGSVYSMSLSDAHHQEQIHPQRFRGVRVISTSLSLGRSGTAVVELYVLPWEAGDAAIGLYGRGGTRICSLTDLEDFKVLPWQDGRLEGYIRCDRLKRTADKTALVQDETYNVFVSRLRQLEPQVMELVMKVSAQAQEQRFNIVLNRAGRVIDRFLRYRDRGLLTDMNMVPFSGMNRGHIFIRQAEGRLGEGESGTTTVKTARPVLHTPTRAPHIMLYSPPEAKSTYRSWYDPKQGIICINREHTEFLLSQRDERRCIRYLFSIWAKESLLQEYGDEAERIADEMVGVLAEAEPLLW